MQMFFASAMLSAGFLEIGHVPALVALAASSAIGAALAAAYRPRQSGSV
jgi:hypothetical protein